MIWVDVCFNKKEYWPSFGKIFFPTQTILWIWFQLEHCGMSLLLRNGVEGNLWLNISKPLDAWIGLIFWMWSGISWTPRVSIASWLVTLKSINPIDYMIWISNKWSIDDMLSLMRILQDLLSQYFFLVIQWNYCKFMRSICLSSKPTSPNYVLTRVS